MGRRIMSARKGVFFNSEELMIKVSWVKPNLTTAKKKV
jgi:hypothetical protein